MAKGNVPSLRNADIGTAEVCEYCRLDDAGKSLLHAAVSLTAGGMVWSRAEVLVQCLHG